jgi:hypothetical protein
VVVFSSLVWIGAAIDAGATKFDVSNSIAKKFDDLGLFRELILTPLLP